MRHFCFHLFWRNREFLRPLILAKSRIFVSTYFGEIAIFASTYFGESGRRQNFVRLRKFWTK
jgi:hypothetical protein